MMTKILPLFLVLVAPSAFAYDLRQHLWQDRLLILVAPTVDDAQLLRQRERVTARRDAVLDRDLRVFELRGDGGWRDGEPLDPADVASLRQEFGVDADDRLMILVGLDGGEKRRAPLDTSLTEFFLQIDAMPMRQDDIRAKREAGIPVTEP